MFHVYPYPPTAMFIVATVVAAVFAGAVPIIFASMQRSPNRSMSHAVRTSAVAVAATTALLVSGSSSVRAAIVPTVGLATAANYSVLAGTTITNTGPSVLDQNAGLSPGTAVVGFPPGQVGVTDAGDATALQAQADLTAAYLDAASRSIDASTTSELGGLTLVGGVYNGPSNSALTLTGTLVLDGQGDPNSVFIFQTGSTLITDSASTVSLINGAQECNVFWQVGSSATLGTGSVFTGNILALTSISVSTGVTVHGRALARNGAVTLDTDVFTSPTCDLASITTTTAAAAAATTTAPDAAATTAPGAVATTIATPPTTTLPPTGTATFGLASTAIAALVVGLAAVLIARRRPVMRP